MLPISIYLSIHLSIYLSIHPSIYLSVYLSIYLSKDYIIIFSVFSDLPQGARLCLAIYAVFKKKKKEEKVIIYN